MSLRLEVLTAAHAVTTCTTGDAEIDHYLHALALAEQAQGLATVYVAVMTDGDVVGYFTLSPLSLRLSALAGVLPGIADTSYPQIGGYLLGRMGVHKSRQSRGVGSALVAQAADMARAQRGRVGGVFLAVDPKTDKLCGFYARFGFRRLDSTGARRRMILPLR